MGYGLHAPKETKGKRGAEVSNTFGNGLGIASSGEHMYVCAVLCLLYISSIIFVAVSCHVTSCHVIHSVKLSAAVSSCASVSVLPARLLVLSSID